MRPEGRKDSEMIRDKYRDFAKALTMAAVLLGAVCYSTDAQRIPITAGATVRVSRPDSTGQPFWSTGRVAYATRTSLLLEETEATDPLVTYNETLRLEVRRGERAMTPAGGGIGLLVGALVKLSTLKAGESRLDHDGANFEPIIVGSVVGAAVGAFVGSWIRVPRWEEVPLQEGQILAAPLDESGTRMEFSLSRTVRWTAFEPTFADFQAFFEEHKDSIDPVEGIWVRTGTHSGIAIVRVVGRDEETYAAYRLREYRGPGRPGEDGILIFALTRANDSANDWHFRLARSSPRRYTAFLEDGVLRLEYPGGALDQWDKWYQN